MSNLAKPAAASESDASSSALDVLAFTPRAVISRIVAATILGLLFGAYVQWRLVGAWYAVYVVSQVSFLILFPPGRPISRAARAFGPSLIFLSSAIYGGVTLLTPLSNGAWGVAVGGWMLAGSSAYVVLTYMGRRRLFLAALTPFPLLGVALAFESRMFGAGWHDVFGLGISAPLGAVVSIALFRAGMRTRDAELAARAESERRRLEAESAVAAKSAFVATVAHELRTPISAILAGSADLQRTLAGADQGKARLIAEAGDMMRVLLNDLLDKAKLDAGKLSVETVSFDARRLVADQLMFWRAEAARKGLKLRLSGARDLPRSIVGDPTRVRQILNNLLSNALKFTSEGQVRLSIVQREIEGQPCLAFTVQDTGPGLTEEAMSRLFGAFEQASASTARNHGGTGLGLAISRDLARLMDGELTVASRPGEGAAFTLRLPLTLADPLATGAATADQDIELALPALRILVVDDHHINRRAMSLILGPMGVQLAEAASGLEALSMLQEQAYDLVLMDCFMPGLDGRQTTRELRAARGPNQVTPVIAVTGSTEDDDIAACLAAGMNDHVAKPIEAAVLFAAIERVLEGVEASQAAA